MKRALITTTLLVLVTAACNPNTSPTTQITNGMGDRPTDPESGFVISSIELAYLGTPEELEELETAGTDPTPGAYGANILGAALPPCARNTEMDSEDEGKCLDSEIVTIDPIDCGVYFVRVTDDAGTACSIDIEEGTGPVYICFSQGKWVLGGRIEDSCGDVWNPPAEE